MSSRVVVAMSGGVDSSVAAALLKEQGYDVIGVSLKLWDYDEDERKLTGKTCCSLDDIADAKDVCDHLGIPFYAFNHKPEFQKQVIERFVHEYHQGRTPNPCVLCNQYIKFDVLLGEAKKMGASYLATGHYARIRKTQGGYELCKGKDQNKDQSYVLHHLTQQDLARVLFPVGDYSKQEIRDLAARYELITQNKKESMEICFIPNNDHMSFIKKNYPHKNRGEGQFVDWDGNVLGTHQGIEAFTIGQRRGLNVSAGERIYVAQIRPETNEVVLVRDEELYFQGVKAKRFSFHQDFDQTKTYGVKLRSQKDEVPAQILKHDPHGHTVELKFLQKARAVTPGQAMVLYDDDVVIGGGWIDQSVY